MYIYMGNRMTQGESIQSNADNQVMTVVLLPYVTKV